MPPKTANPPPAELQQLSALMQDGYRLLDSQLRSETCDHWLSAWELVKSLTTPDMQDVEAFDAAYRGLPENVLNWCQDLEQELGNAGFDNPVYHEQRIRYAHEFLDRFGNTDDVLYLNFRRAEGEALWMLGRHNEAEAVYAALVERLPDDSWSYIGWADQYWLFDFAPKEYAQAEAIMVRALARPQLTDRGEVLDRMQRLYTEWNKPERAAEMRAELMQTRETKRRPLATPPTGMAPISQMTAQKRPRPGRNDPCWCGSGKTYKRCHLQADKQQDRDG
jgi:hypothetical protein